MTNQQLKAHCEDVIANPQDHMDWVVDMARVALASLDAEPYGHLIDSDVHIYANETAKFYGSQGLEIRPVYTAPPVPELKMPDVSEGDPGKLHDVRTRHDFSNGFRFAIEEVKRLNGVTS